MTPVKATTYNGSGGSYRKVMFATTYSLPSGYGTHIPKVVSSNPGTIYWMDIFSHLFVVKIVMCVWKDKNK